MNGWSNSSVHQQNSGSESALLPAAGVYRLPMVELTDTDQPAEETSDAPRLLVAALKGLLLAGLPLAAAWGAGVFEGCAASLLLVTGVLRPPPDAGVRWYTGRALLAVGVVTLVLVAVVDPLGGDTDSIFGYTSIIVGAAIAQTASAD